MSYVVEFSGAGDRAVVGGKGFGLHRLASWGLNVPSGFVVASSAYENALTTAGINLADVTPHADEVRSAVAAVEVSSELWTCVAESLKQLEERHGDSLRVSCRSSATAEDSATASFAGQFATVLGVAGMEGVVDGIKQCWASVWSPEAVSYRATNGISHRDVSMAVVVQKMVNATSSGVAFSVNPITGSTDEVMINSNWGLGETVVSGLVTPDMFLVDRSGLTISLREISQAKTVSHVISDDGSVEARSVGPLEAMSPSLTDEQVFEVAALAVEVEGRAGAPQDIEWAYEDGVLFVLQTRPITTL